MTRLWFLRRPLLMFAAVAALAGVCVGVASAVNAQHKRHRDQAFQTWVQESEAATEAKLPILIKKVSTVRLPAYVHGDRRPKRVGRSFAAMFGPLSSSRSVSVSSAALVATLRAAGFTRVTVSVTPLGDGNKIVGSVSDGTVTLTVRRTSTGASRIVGSLAPDMPRCC